MTETTLKDALVEELQDLLDAENQLVKALPKMAKAAQNEKLQAGFTDHLEETRGHVQRLEEALRLLSEPVKSTTCPAMKGLVKEGAEIISDHEATPVRDALLIGAAQRVEHYEIAAYGTARAMAQALGETEVAGLLQETLDEEGAADKKLTAVAEEVNPLAAGDAGSTDDDGDAPIRSTRRR
jgi:ferritin-like metal-binding protein YciE